MIRILIMAGEASGDQHGARLAAALKERRPDVRLLGLGGRRMEAAGVDVLDGIERLDIIGVPSFAEARQALRMYRRLTERLRAMQLDAVVLIDNPGLNLRLARVAKAAGHKVVYFVAPQIWAWNRGRIATIKSCVDLVLPILPFEAEIYREAGVRSLYVGHPLIDDIPADLERAGARSRLGIPEGKRVVGLLPGSRKRETLSVLTTMLEAAARLGGARAELVIGEAPSLPEGMIAELVARSGVDARIVRDKTFDVMAAADALAVASGTATLQSAVVGAPMVIVYRTSWFTGLIARRVIKLQWVGLANIVAGRSIATELIQEDFTTERLRAELQRLLDDPGSLERAGATGRELRAKLGERGAAGRAADAILAEVGEATSVPAP